MNVLYMRHNPQQPQSLRQLKLSALEFLKSAMDEHSMHIAMFPWFAMGHLTPYLHLANKLAKKGHKISFFTPRGTQSKLEHFNLNPHLITFVPINVPHVEGLPEGAETTADVPFSLYPLIATAMDQTEKNIEILLLELKPNIVFFDFSFWLPDLTRSLGIKSLQYCIANPATMAYLATPYRWQQQELQGGDLTEVDIMNPPPAFPDPSITLHPHEARFLASSRKWLFGSGIPLYQRFQIGFKKTDAVGFKGSREIEGPFLEYLQSQYQKPFLLSGPLIPEPSKSNLEPKWVTWLGKFEANSVIYCAFGSEAPLHKNEFQELLLGLELSNMPFLAVLRAPIGSNTMEEAIPKGFADRVKGRGIVYGGWVQQHLILGHSSVGCFITHCGATSLTEGLVNECQLVLLPRLGADHIMNARIMGSSLKIGVEVEKGEEDGLFTKESVSKAVKIVMDENSEIGREVRTNHTKWRNHLLSKNLEDSLTESFCHELQELLLQSN